MPHTCNVSRVKSSRKNENVMFFERKDEDNSYTTSRFKFL